MCDLRRQPLAYVLLLILALSFLLSDFCAAAAFEDESVFVIDPGHGGFDGGAVGVNGIAEKELNLAISLKVSALFSLFGRDCRLTRDEDISLDSEGDAIRERKRSDIHNRIAFVEAQQTPVYIGIHMNKFPIAKYHGAQVFYSPNNPLSQDLARSLQCSVSRFLDTSNRREPKCAEDGIYILKTLRCPAVIFECGFLSNPDESELLLHEEYQLKLALCAVYGCIFDN